MDIWRQTEHAGLMQAEPAEAWVTDERDASSFGNDAQNQRNNIDNTGVPLYSYNKTATSELKNG